MVPFIPFLIGIQIVHTLAASTAPSFVYPSCNSFVVKAAAEVALDKSNSNQTQGYALGLQRIFDVQELPQWDGKTLFYLVLDVIETDCHVLSRKSWKECNLRNPHESVYGQCKVIIEFNRHSDDWHLHRYDCNLQPVIAHMCPDCPTLSDPSEASFQETAAETLAKFNAENKDNNYFAILNVTRASSQWVVGPANFVEYTIQETSCPKNPPVSDITQCPFLSAETAERGLCKGSVVNSRIENRKFVDVKCHFFPRPPPVADEQTPQSTSEPQEPQHAHPSSDIAETSPKQKETVGQVIYHYPGSKHAVPEVHESNPNSSPTLASPEEKTNSHSAIPPFPRGFSQSAECPGDILLEVYGLQLPSRPQAETS